jgi:hypothetical protein
LNIQPSAEKETFKIPPPVASKTSASAAYAFPIDSMTTGWLREYRAEFLAALEMAVRKSAHNSR